MSWSVKQQIANNLAVNNTVDADAQYPSFASASVSMSPGMTAAVQIVVTFPGTSTNDLAFRIVGTLDDAAEVWDTLPLTAGSVSRAASGSFTRTVLVSDVYKCRVEFRKLGTASETITVNVFVRTNGVSI